MYVDSTDEMAHRYWRPWSPYGVLGRNAWQMLERDAYLSADHVFATSTVTAESVISHYGVGRERVSVVGAGSNFHPLPALRARPRTSEILFVGRDWGRKGGPELLAAFEKVRQDIPEARLIVTGILEVPAGPGVEMVGMQDRRQLADRFESAAVFCMPSRFDPFPNTLMEAMAYSLPCVSTTTAGIPELVLDGQTGLLVQPGDIDGLARALLRVLRDDDLADRLGRACRIRVERELTWDRVVDRMKPVFDRMGVSPAAV